MFKSVLFVVCFIPWLCLADSKCEKPLYAVAISNPWNYAPVKQLLGIFQAGIYLGPIQSGAYKIDNIHAQPAIDETDVNIPVVGAKLGIQIALTYYINFTVFDQSQVIVANGSALLTNALSNFNLNIETTTYTSWTFTSLNVVMNSQLANIGCSILFQPAQYQQLVTALTTGENSIAQQLQDEFAEDSFKDGIKRALTQFTDFAASYYYNYPDMNNLKQTILYNTTYTSLTNTNNVITGYRAQTIIGFADQVCPQTGAQLPNPLPGQQVEVFSFESFQASFEYAADLYFFDADLTPNWNSQYFQFYAASLKNILEGVDQNFLITSPAEGTCITTDHKLTLNDQTLSATMNANCYLYYFGQTSGERLISVTFALAMNAVPSIQNNNELLFLGSQPTVTKPVWSSQNFQLVNEDLANFYLNSLVQNALSNKPIFGSFYTTLIRTSTKFLFQNNQFIIYQPAQATSEE